MKCPSCKKSTERLLTLTHKGELIKFCPRCPGMTIPKFRSHRQRKYDRWELPRDVIKQTQALRPTKRYPDSPILRDRVNATPVKPRCVTYDWGSTSRSSADVRAQIKAQNKLGLNAKLLFSDGFKRTWEQGG